MAQASSNQMIECEICMENVSSLKILPCNHQLCLTCVTVWSQKGANNTVACPNCRKQHRLSPENIARLPTFYSGLIKCSVCRVQKQSSHCYWCPTCIEIICATCHIDQHLSMHHKVFKWETHQAIKDLWNYSLMHQTYPPKRDYPLQKQVVKDFCKKLETELLKKLDEMKNKKVAGPDIPLHDHLSELFGELDISGARVIKPGEDSDKLQTASEQMLKFASGETYQQFEEFFPENNECLIDFQVSAEAIAENIWNQAVLCTPEQRLMESREVTAEILKSNNYEVKEMHVKNDRGSCVSVQCMQCDQTRIVFGCGDGSVSIFDRETLVCKYVLHGHSNSVCCLQFNTEMILSGGEDKNVRVWDIHTGEQVNILKHHSNTIYYLRFHKKMLVTGSMDNTIAVWKINSAKDIALAKVLKGHNDWVMSVDLDSRFIVSGSFDETVKIWSASSGELMRTLSGHTFCVWCLQLRGNFIVSSGDDKTIRVH